MNTYKRKCIGSILVIFSLLLGQCLTFRQEVSGVGLAQEAEYQAFLPVVVLDSFVPSRGVLDPSFGEDGIVSTNFGPYAVAAINDLALQPDGKIVAAGHTEVTDYYNFNFTLARYNLDGSLDGSFGEGGSVMTDITFYDSAEAVVIQPDGKILAAGLALDIETYLIDAVLLVRYHPDGSLDAGFGDGGLVLSDFGSTGRARDLALQQDGKILVVGESGDDFLLARYTPDGLLDASFDGDGWVTAGFSQEEDYATSLLVQPDGRILVGGVARPGGSWYYALARYNMDGSLDPSFDGDGTRIVTEMQCGYVHSHTLALQPDGKMIVVCNSADTSDFILARINPDGSLDAGFGEAGLVRTDWGGLESPTCLALQPDGKIIAAGFVTAHGSGYSFILARYHPDGSLDESFGYYGQVMTDIAPQDYAYALALQRDGKIVLAGYFADYLPVDFGLVRYK
jgi:uncharacterized delta-60 repeat protein